MTRMATMPTYSKTPLKIIYSYKLDGRETWYKASGTWALQSLYKWWPWVDLGLFYNKVNFVYLGFYMKKNPEKKNLQNKKLWAQVLKFGI